MVCGTDPVNLEMELDPATLQLLADIQGTSFTPLSLGDDAFSDTVNLGFSLEFYGSTYSKCILSSNNFISFNTAYALQSTPYTISNALPDASTNLNASKLKNTILAPWQDIQPNVSGFLDYATVGTAPNRVFVVRWFDVPMYLCSALYFSSAILIYENGDKIETHIVNKPYCTWNNGLAVHGLQNNTGSIAEIVTDPTSGLDRNLPNTWSTTIEGVRFSPNGANDYTTSFIDFIPIISVANLNWKHIDGTFLGIGSSLEWDPLSTNNDIDTIIVQSPSYASTFTDTIILISDPQLDVSVQNPSTACEFDTVVLEYNIHYADSVLWSTGETTPTISVDSTGTYSIQVFIDSCIYTNSQSVLIEASSFDLGNDTLLCYGDSLVIGTAYAGVDFQWQDGHDGPFYTVKEPGTYHLNMLLNGCPYSDTIVIDFTEPFTFPSDTMVCDGDPFYLDATYPGATSYLWQDGSTDSTFLVSQTGAYNVVVETDMCTHTGDLLVFFIDSLDYDLGPDTAICEGDTFSIGSFVLSASYLWQDGSTPVKYNVEETGMYTVEVTLGNCFITDSIYVEVFPIPEVDLGDQEQFFCGDSMILDATSFPGSTYLWTDSTTDSTLVVYGPGLYDVVVDNNGCLAYDTVLVIDLDLVLYDIAPDTMYLCDGDNIELNATFATATYEWQDGTPDPIYNVTTTGTYIVQTFVADCVLSDTVYVEVVTSPNVSLGPDSVLICEGEILNLDVTYPGATYEWQDGTTNPLYEVQLPGTYWVEVSLGSCLFKDTLVVEVNPLSSFEFGPDLTLCDGEQIVLSGFTPGATYLWNNGSPLSYQSVTQPGTYILDVTLNNCVKSDTIVIDFLPLPTFVLGPDITICQGDTAYLDAYYPGGTYLWQDGSTDAVYKAYTPGIYSAVVELNGCTFKDQINVTVNDSIQIQLIDTVSFCIGDSFILDATYPDINTEYQWNDGDQQALHVVKDPGPAIVTLSLGGCLFKDTTFVIVRDLPDVNLSDALICKGENHIFNAYTPDAVSYQWQDGSTGSSYIAEDEGWYWVITQNDHCSTRDSVYLSVDDVPQIVLPSDTFLCEDNEIAFSFTDTNLIYLWEDGVYAPYNSISEVGQYELTVTNHCGSTYSSMTVIREDCLCSFFVPNGLVAIDGSPNQYFELFPECNLKSFYIRIHNRWGKEVFYTEEWDNFWDGTYQGELLPQDSYIYQMEYSFEGELGVTKKTGIVTLLH
jgi:gliding motility-associated-like protein